MRCFPQTRQPRNSGAVASLRSAPRHSCAHTHILRTELVIAMAHGRRERGAERGGGGRRDARNLLWRKARERRNRLGREVVVARGLDAKQPLKRRLFFLAPVHRQPWTLQQHTPRACQSSVTGLRVGRRQHYGAPLAADCTRARTCEASSACGDRGKATVHVACKPLLLVCLDGDHQLVLGA